MVSTTADTLLHQLRSVLIPCTGTAATDADLLGRFIGTRDERAFEALVRRHGPMVLGVCRRVLGHEQDAEDAFQASFLVLARKAGSVQPPAALGRWLHGVAYHTALKARRTAARRQAHERRAIAQAVPPAGNDGFEVRGILDEELSRLPKDYRAAVVLCDLEGLPRREAAARLGWPEGTVAGRLTRARELLAGRLKRRGLALPAGAVLTGLAQAAAATAVSSALAGSTLRLLRQSTAGEAAASAARVAGLAESTVRTMALSKWKAMLWAACLVALAFGLGAGGLLLKTQADPLPIAQRQPRAGAGAGEGVPAPGRRDQPLLRVPIPGRTMLTTALSPHARYLAIARQDGTTAQLWDVAAGKEHTLRGHAFPIVALAFSPDERLLASATGSWLPDGAPGEIKLWDVAAQQERATLERSPTMVLALAFSADGKRLASAGATVKVWEVATGQELLELRPAGGPTWALAFSPDGRTLATAVGVREDDTPGFVRLWDTTTGKERAPLEGHRGVVCSVAFTPDGKTLVSADSRGTLLISDPATGKHRFTIRNPGRSFFLQSLAVTSRAILGILLQGDESQILKQWEVATGRETPVPAASPASANPLVLSGDGSVVGVTGSGPGERGHLELWELASPAHQHRQRPGGAAASDPVTPAPPASGDPVERELKQLEGTWQPIAYESAGEKVQGEELRKYDWARYTLTIKDGKVQTRSEGDVGPLMGLKVDLSKAPKAMDRTILEGTAKGHVIRSVYEFDGTTLRICTAFEGDDVRPKGCAAPGTFVISHRRVRAEPAGRGGDADPWTPLFNGKDLTGWSVEGGDREAWRAERDELLVNAARDGRRSCWLLSKKTYADFLLRFEYQLSEQGASGVAVWATPYEKVHPEGPNHLQVKLVDDPNCPKVGWPTGTLFWNVDGASHLRPDRRAKLEPVGSWNRVEIEARAQSLRVSVNGLEVLRTRPDRLAGEPGAYAGFKRCTGHIGFVKGAGVARFRKIEIKELEPAKGPQEQERAPASTVTPTGGTGAKEVKPRQSPDEWVSLFNHKDLSGWKTHALAPGDWRVEDGLLIGRGPRVSHLYTKRNDYEDFHFRVEAKINARGNSGQCFRKQFSARVGGDGYEAQIDSGSHKAKTGSLYIHTGPAVAVEQALVPADTWFTQEVIVRRNRIVILVNGTKTVDFIDRNNNYARGHLALQVDDPETVVQFRQIEVKELSAAAQPPD